MVGPVVWTAFLWDESRERLKGSFGQEWATDMEYLEWLMKKDKMLVGGEEVESKVTNMCRVFAWAAAIVKDKLEESD